MWASLVRFWPILFFSALSGGARAGQWEIPAQCQRPSEGQHLDVLNHPGARLPANYRLAVLPPIDGHQRFEAILNVQFIRMDYTLTPTGYKGFEPVSPDEERRYRLEVQSCWDQASQFMIGPSGETLRIRLADPNTDEITLPERRVVVNSELPEGVHSGAWLPSLASCGSAIHETLHLLGLDDEYGNGCRAEGPADSVMNDAKGSNTRIWKAALQSGGHVEITCGCQPWLPGVVSERQCKKIVAAMTSHGATCPKGTAETRSALYTNLMLAGDPLRQSQLREKLAEYGNGKQTGNAENPNYSWIQKVPPQSPSVTILYPAQFRTIVWPNCERENRTYYSCVANDHRAYGIACQDLPAVCRSPSDWLK